MNKQDLARDLVRSCKMIFNQDLARSPCKYLQDQWWVRLSKIILQVLARWSWLDSKDQARDLVRISKIKQDWSYSRLSKRSCKNKQD